MLQKETEKILYNYFPAEFIKSVTAWQVDDFVKTMKSEYNLYFGLYEKRLNHLAWWYGETPYKTNTNYALGFEKLGDKIKGQLLQKFPESLLITFMLKRSYSFEKNLLIVEVSSEVFFSLDLIYNKELSAFFETEFIFISNPEFTNWMIPDRLTDMWLNDIITNFQLSDNSNKIEVKPWQAYFAKLNITDVDVSIDLFEHYSFNDSVNTISKILSDVEDHLIDYYYDRLDTKEVAPEFIFDTILQLANDSAYDDKYFVDVSEEKKSLKQVLKETLENWYYGKQDAFSDKSDPDNIFSKDALNCLNKIG